MTKIASILALLSLLGLALLSLFPPPGRGLLMASPVFPGQTISLPQLEELEEKGILFTFEARSHAQVTAVRADHTAVVIGTNPLYAQLTGYPLLAGSFFTEGAADQGSRHAVLGETAARTLFGGVQVVGEALRINGEDWRVVGVMKDGDKKNLNLYVPAGTQAASPAVILAPLTGRSAAEVQSELARWGLPEEQYRYHNLQTRADCRRLHWAIAALWGLCAALLFIIRVGLSVGRDSIRALRDIFADRYPSDWLRCNPGAVFRLFLLAGAVAAGCLGLLLASSRLLELLLQYPLPVSPAGFAEFSALLRTIWLRQIAGMTAAGCFVLTVPVTFVKLYRFTIRKLHFVHILYPHPKKSIPT